jgi:hypothetical protein
VDAQTTQTVSRGRKDGIEIWIGTTIVRVKVEHSVKMSPRDVRDEGMDVVIEGSCLISFSHRQHYVLLSIGDLGWVGSDNTCSSTKSYKLRGVV